MAKRKRASVKKVPVLHSYYELEPSAHLPDDTCGMTISGTRRKVIKIADTQDEPAIWATTFWHEFGHAMFNELGWMQDFENESKVEGFAHAMMVMLTDPNGRAIIKDMLRGLKEKS